MILFNNKRKKEKEALKKQKANMSELKEYRLSPVIDVGDFETKLRNAVKYLRNTPNVDRVNTKYGFKFVISRSFKECPVNICIEKRIYNKICKLHRFVGKFDYEKLSQ